MNEPVDPAFYDRADALIHLANEQLENINRGKVSASFLYAAARFNAWISANGFESGDSMREARDKTVEYFIGQFRAALEENLDDYIRNFDGYMKRGVQ